MSNDLAVTIAVLAALASIATISGFIFARMKDAEQRGRQAQRIDMLEDRQAAYEAARKDDLKAIDAKYDKLLDKLEKISTDLKMIFDSHVSDYHRGA